MRASAVLAVGLAGMLFHAPAGLSQTPAPAPSQQPTFRASTELVELDVVVVDKHGVPVHGLTRDDFVVTDRKKPQTIEAFQEIRREAEPEAPTLPVSSRVDVATNTSPQAGRLVVLVLDDLHTFRGRSETVKSIAKKIVTDLGPESSMALIQTGGDHNVDVTNDRSRLMDAIDKFAGRRPYRRPIEACDPKVIPIAEDGTPTSQGCDQMEFGQDIMFYGALQNAAKLLGANDRRRKAFVLVSENLAKDLSGLFQVGVPPSTPIDASAVFRSGDISGLASVPTQPADQHSHALLDMMEALRKGGVAVYSIDPRGEVNSQKLAEECSPVWGGIDDPCLGGDLLPDWYAWPRQAQHGLEIMSEASGGFAVVNTNDFTSGIGRILSDLDNYYQLGFYTPDTKSTGYRPLEVTVNGRSDLTLRYRRGYQISPQASAAAAKSKDPLGQLVEGALPKNDLPMRLHAIPMPYSAKEARVAVAMEITVPRKSLQSADQLLDQIQFGLFAVDLKGAKVRERAGWGARIALRPRPGLKDVPDQVTYEIVSNLQLPFGQYQLRASARSDKLDAGGSVYLALDVPDFSKAPIALTDLLIAYADGAHVPIAHSYAPMAVTVANLLPFDPTLDRVFSPHDTLRLYTRVVQQTPAPTNVTVAALAPDGRVMLTLTRELTARENVPVDLKLPLAQLGPGAYRLQVTASDGRRTAAREIAITIK